ncbi:MAG: glycosyltransferase family 4 protein, partial [Actinobacteria bacterium]|nr:glycosyltransferase family 4 protein [Actinomycetota bacterium]
PAGRLWHRAQNVAALDRVAPPRPWPVLVAGYPDLASPARHARALGHVEGPELASLFARAAIYASPAVYEPFGLGPLEAALAGCALVLGDIPTLREIWRDAALFVEPGDDEALSRTLRLLIEDEPLRHELAARGRERARTYTPERMASGYLEVYERLLNVDRARALV